MRRCLEHRGREPARDRVRAGFTFVHLLVVVALVALITALIIPVVVRARAKSSLVVCKDHLRQCGVAIARYAQISRGQLPLAATVDGPQRELIDCLNAAGCLGDKANLYCPAQSGNFAFSEDHFRAGVIGYFYYAAMAPSSDKQLSKFLRTGVSWPRELKGSMDPKTWVMSDIWTSGVPTVHGGYRKGVNYLQLDGSVGFIAESPRQAFQ